MLRINSLSEEMLRERSSAGMSDGAQTHFQKAEAVDEALDRARNKSLGENLLLWIPLKIIVPNYVVGLFMTLYAHNLLS